MRAELSSSPAGLRTVLRRLLPPLAGALILIVPGFGFLLVRQGEEILRGEIGHVEELVPEAFGKALEFQAHGLMTVLEVRTHNNELPSLLAAGDPFRIAMVDLQMPGMDGEELGMSIKSDPDLRDTCLFMLTSLDRRGDAARSVEIGFAAYLTKPLRQSDLYKSLSRVLGDAETVGGEYGEGLDRRG